MSQEIPVLQFKNNSAYPGNDGPSVRRKQGPHLRLLFILLVALVHGLLYVFIVPAWQHYDEPNHFEYAWLIARRGSLPQPGDYDRQMRRDVAVSMLAAGFFDDMAFRPDLEASGQPAWIGAYSQLGDPPLYYIFAALPLWIFSRSDVTVQLYVARLFSLGLYLATVVAAWGLTRELTRPGSPLRWLVPLTMVLIPAFTDLMTSVNSDVAAVTAFSFFLWASVRLLRGGFSWFRLAAVSGTAILCLGIKSNVFVAVPLLLPVLAFTIFPWRWHRLIGSVLVTGCLMALLAIFTGGQPAFWYRQANHADLARLQDGQAMHGKHVFMVETSRIGTSPTRASRFWQIIAPEVLRPFEGQVVTLGSWAWASQPVQIASPTFHTWGGNLDFAQNWSLGVRPTFYTFTFTLPLGADHGWISLLPLAEQAGIRVYFDGLVLAPGERPASPPSFINHNAQAGNWGYTFENLLRGASAEVAWPGVRSWADAFSARLFPDRGRFSFVLYSLMDWPGTRWYYRAVAANLLRSFWARFGWGNVALAYGRPYVILAFATGLGLVASLLSCLERRRYLHWPTLFYLALSLLTLWAFTFVRGSIYLVYQQHFVPAARYAYPVILPTVLTLADGWVWAGRLLLRALHIPVQWLLAAYALFFVALDIFSIVSIVHFYA